MAEDRKNFNADLPRATQPLSEPIPSRDGTTALMSAVITGDGQSDTILDPVDQLRDEVSDPGGGLQAKVTGPAGYAADAIKVFEGINGTLLLAAVSLVIILLILIYRSPIFWLIPLIAVVFAEITVQGLGYGLTELGRHRQRPVLVDPLRARARRGHRLRAAARLALPGGAAQARRQARGAEDGAAHRRAGDLRLRLHGDRGAARASRSPRSTRPPAWARSARWASPWRCSRCSPSCRPCSPSPAAARSGAPRSSAWTTASRTSATRAPTRRTAPGAGSASAWRAPRGGSGSPPRRS